MMSVCTSFSDISKYDVETLLKVASGSQTNRYSMVVEMTTELLMIEMINRVSVCWFEVSCLWGDDSTRVSAGRASRSWSSSDPAGGGGAVWMMHP